MHIYKYWTAGVLAVALVFFACGWGWIEEFFVLWGVLGIIIALGWIRFSLHSFKIAFFLAVMGVVLCGIAGTATAISSSFLSALCVTIAMGLVAGILTRPAQLLMHIKDGE